MRFQLSGQALADVNILRRKVYELDEGVQGTLNIPPGRLSLCIREEVLAGIGEESLPSPDLSHAKKEDVPIGEIPQDFLADSDGVVR